MHIQEGIWARN